MNDCSIMELPVPSSIKTRAQRVPRRLTRTAPFVLNTRVNVRLNSKVRRYRGILLGGWKIWHQQIRQ
jgi:hypothetical protein